MVCSNAAMPERWRIQPGEPVKLDSIDPSSTPGAPGGKAEILAQLPSLQVELAGLQERLWAEHRRSLLVILQALDGGGKDGTIGHVFQGVNPQGTRVTSFKEPVGEETEHDFLWRVHREAPCAGEIGIFNRSHYEDVLVVRVLGLVPETVWKARYDLINGFEKTLHHGGTTIVKIYLLISKEEQRRRLQARLDDPNKRWKFRTSDLAARRCWGEYREAYEDAIEKTSTQIAPWYVIPADHKWYRNWAVSRILIKTLRTMDPRYPQPVEDLPATIE
jgi:PPK2 family polyphosphate:nucleotide phosphotransferase